METKAFDFAAALKDPKGTFKSPHLVLADARLSRSQKIELLKHWEQDARSLAVAEEEGMGGGESDMLQRVLLALKTICGDEEAATPAANKQGGSMG